MTSPSTTSEVEPTLDSTTTTEPATTTTAAPAALPDVDSYCALSSAADRLLDEFEAYDDPVETEVVFTQIQALADQGRDVAPLEIEEEFSIVADAWTDLVLFLQASEWDYGAALEAADSLLSSPEVVAASDAVDAFDAATCPPADDVELSLGDEPLIDPEDADAMLAILETEIGREAFIEGFIESTNLTYEQAGCFLDTAPIESLVTMTSQEASASDMVAFFDALETCDIPLSALS